jgi:hypothetical protein
MSERRGCFPNGSIQSERGEVVKQVYAVRKVQEMKIKPVGKGNNVINSCVLQF